jgi:6-phosphofructokinase
LGVKYQFASEDLRMTPRSRTIGVLIGSGDCPGLNAAIRGIVHAGKRQHGWKLIGVRDAFGGLIWPEQSHELTFESTRGILPQGGTILGRTNSKDPFAFPVTQNTLVTKCDCSGRCFEGMEKLGIGKIEAGESANLLAHAIREHVDKGVRVTVLGHLQRGGTPSPFDRTLAARFGAGAVEFVERNAWGKMLALRGSKLAMANLGEAINPIRLVDPRDELVRAARAIGICFGDTV